MKLYIAGRVVGSEDSVAEIDRTTFALRDAGHMVFSAWELYDEIANVESLSPRDFMPSLLGPIFESDGVVLVNGWHQTTDSVTEVAVAVACGLPLYQLSSDGELLPYSTPDTLFVRAWQ